MHFHLSPEQEQLVASVRRFVDSRVLPNAHAWDQQGAWPKDLRPALAELGVLGLLASEDNGGAGLGSLELALVIERLAEGCAGLALSVLEHNVFGVALAQQRGDADVATLAAGERLVVSTHALSSAGTTLAPLAGEPDAIVRDATHPTSVGGATKLLGLHAARFSHLPAAMTSKPADTAPVMSLAQLGAAALATGVGKRAIKVARAYALERKQFGTPIAEFQAIQWKLADAATQIDAARMLWGRAALPGAKQHGAAMAKLSAADAAVRATDEALQIHGGYGYVRELEVERLYRDAQACGVLYGTRHALVAEVTRAALA